MPAVHRLALHPVPGRRRAILLRLGLLAGRAAEADCPVRDRHARGEGLCAPILLLALLLGLGAGWGLSPAACDTPARRTAGEPLRPARGRAERMPCSEGLLPAGGLEQPARSPERAGSTGLPSPRRHAAHTLPLARPCPASPCKPAEAALKSKLAWPRDVVTALLPQSATGPGGGWQEAGGLASEGNRAGSAGKQQSALGTR